VNVLIRGCQCTRNGAHLKSNFAKRAFGRVFEGSEPVDLAVRHNFIAGLGLLRGRSIMLGAKRAAGYQNDGRCISMNPGPTTPLGYRPGERKPFIRDDLAYVIPMAAFLVLTEVGAVWPSLYPAVYAVKTIVVAILLVVVWPHYTKVRWNYGWLGAIFGVVGVVQWVGMETVLLHHWPNYFRPAIDAFDPYEKIHAPAIRWMFIAIRLAGATLLVPVMEELFWRDFLWRTILAPNDFKLAGVGEIDWKAFLAVSIIFSFVHVQWMTAIVWGMMIGGLLMATQSLGACIIMHGVTNLLLGLYVLKTGKWYFW
jgi:CAAX prenyl protease-like protein